MAQLSEQDAQARPRQGIWVLAMQCKLRDKGFQTKTARKSRRRVEIRKWGCCLIVKK